FHVTGVQTCALPICQTTPAEFADLIAALLAETTVRTGGATHPSLRILGAIEARLARADRMILAGLEEGVWPNAAPVDPFLSRPMRARSEEHTTELQSRENLVCRL